MAFKLSRLISTATAKRQDLHAAIVRQSTSILDCEQKVYKVTRHDEIIRSGIFVPERRLNYGESSRMQDLRYCTDLYGVHNGIYYDEKGFDAATTKYSKIGKTDLYLSNIVSLDKILERNGYDEKLDEIELWNLYHKLFSKNNHVFLEGISEYNLEEMKSLMKFLSIYRHKPTEIELDNEQCRFVTDWQVDSIEEKKNYYHR